MTITFLSTRVDVWVAVVLGLAATFDLCARWLAFGRFDSFGISIATFSSVYSVVELVFAEDDLDIAVSRAAWAILPLLFLLVYHKYAYDKLDKKFVAKATELRNTLDGKPDRIEVFDSAMVSARRSLLVSFAGQKSKVRTGKAEWRKELCRVINAAVHGKQAAAPNQRSKNYLRPEDLLLPKEVRTWGLILFTGLGAVSFLAQVVTFV